MKSSINLTKTDPKVQEVLRLLGVGVFLAASLIFPGLPLIVGKGIREHENQKWQKSKKEWEKYNLWRLRQVIKRMQQSKYVEIHEENGIQTIQITEKGEKRLLSYNLETIKLDESQWDGKWRLIIYDVENSKRNNSEMFRRFLNRLRLLKLQKSVYLTPFKCEKEIEYLRQIFNIGNEVLILTVRSLEKESAYRKYFGI